jgi:phosphate-selective porin OprO/OprP
VLARADDAALEKRVRILEEKLAVEEKEDQDKLDAQWKNGFRFSTEDGAFTLRPRVLIQVDTATFSGEEDVNEALAAQAEEGEEPDQVENGAEFRRARFGFEGTLYKSIEFEIMYDFAGSDAIPKDVYIGMTEIPGVGTLRVGHQREPFSRLQGSDTQRIFMEKGAQDALAPDRGMGVRLINSRDDGRLAWSAGAFYLTDDDGSSLGENAYALTARLAGQPWFDEENDRRLHLGIAGSYREPDDAEIDYGARPESHLVEKLIGREPFTADDVQLLGTEAAWQWGAFMLLGEYIVSDVSGVNGAEDATFDGYFVTASYFLTGEHRAYDTEECRFSRVKPKKNFREGGPGAWEFAARVAAVDLTDTDPSQGEMQDYTAAINWYLNPVTRFMLNYVYADAEDAGDLHVIEARLQLDL